MSNRDGDNLAFLNQGQLDRVPIALTLLLASLGVPFDPMMRFDKGGGGLFCLLHEVDELLLGMDASLLVDVLAVGAYRGLR